MDDEPEIAQKGPYEMEVQAGRMYPWCQCGFSNGQPLCDSSHRVTAFLPMMWQAQEDGNVKFCGCKRTKTPPFCDGSHESL